MNFTYKDIGFWMLIIGGLGLFLYGITLISKTLKRLTGNKLRKIIDGCSKNRFTGLLTGAGFTAAVQSSGATSALSIGLVRAGSMTLEQAIPIIIGANIGTTITAFIVSIPIMEYMPVFVLIGSVIVMLATRKRMQDIGDLFFSIGLIFLGLWIVQQNLELIAAESFFIDLFVFLANNPWLGLLLGAILTALLQSSSAVVGVIQGIYAASIIAFRLDPSITAISLFGVLPIVFGSNIGSTSTALIASIGGSKDAKRVALFHLFFNLCGALVFMILLYPCKPLIINSYEWKIDAKLQLALSHLLFNMVASIIFLPLTKIMCKLMRKIVPGEDKINSLVAIKELDAGSLKKFPSEGIRLAKEQVVVMFSYTKTMLETINVYINKPNKEDASFVYDIESRIDSIDRNLNEYLLQADKGELSDYDLRNYARVMKACKDIERIGDYGNELMNFYEGESERKEKINENTKQIFIHANEIALALVIDTIDVFVNEDKQKALDLIKNRRFEISKLDEYISKHYDDIKNNGKNKVQYIDLVFVDILNSYERIYSHCSNIAKLFATDKNYRLSVSEEEHFNEMSNRY